MRLDWNARVLRNYTGALKLFQNFAMLALDLNQSAQFFPNSVENLGPRPICIGECVDRLCLIIVLTQSRRLPLEMHLAAHLVGLVGTLHIVAKGSWVERAVGRKF